MTTAFEEAAPLCSESAKLYASVSHRLKYDVLNPPKLLRKKLSTQPMGDALKIYPVPLVLSKGELTRIRNGAEQRLLALALFFEDLVLRKQSCLRDQQIPRSVVHSIMRDAGWKLTDLRRVWNGKKFRHISILSGSDLVRTPSLEWAFIEDNIGGTDRMLGGIADLQFGHAAFLRSVSRSIRGGVSPKPLTQFLTKWRDVYSIEDSTLLVAIGLRGLLANSMRIRDKEEFRVLEIIRSVFPGARPYGELFLSLLEPIRNRVEKARNPCRAVVNLGPDCRSAIRPHFSEYFQKGNIPFFVGIGTEILANKGLLPFTDSLIRYYLAEHSIIPTTPTSILNSQYLDSKRLLSKVIKRADGIQGTSVHIFPRMKSRKQRKVFRDVKNQILRGKREGKTSDLWVEQDYVGASFIRDRDSGRKMEINVRPFAYLMGGTVQVSSVPWGRIGSRSPQPLVNISQGAHQLMVLAGS